MSTMQQNQDVSSSPKKRVNWKKAAVGAVIFAVGYGFGAMGTTEPAPEQPTVVSTPQPPADSLPEPQQEPVQPPVSGTSTLTREQQLLALQMAWEQQTEADRDAVCDGLPLLGVKQAAQILIDSAGDQFEQDVVEEFLTEACG